MGCMLHVFYFSFLSSMVGGLTYPCALIGWFSVVGKEPCTDTGMWIVQPDLNEVGRYVTAVVLLDTILHSTHLIGVATDELLL